MKSQFELVNHLQIKHVKVIVNQISNRPPHVHSDFELTMALTDGGVLETRAARHIMNPGDIIFINSYENHSYYSVKKDEDGKDDGKSDPIFLIVQISYHFLMDYFPPIRNTFFKTCDLKEFFDERELHLIRRLLLASGRDYFNHDGYYQLRLVTKLSYLLRILLLNVPNKVLKDEEKEKVKRRFERIQRVVSYIDENYSGKIRLEEIAQKEGITIPHLSHIFSEYFGISFQEYVNLKRLEKAVLLMQDERKSLINVAFESGFSDPKYMNQLFKKNFNCKPRQYRTQARNHIHNLSSLPITQKERLLPDELASQEIEDYIRRNGISMEFDRLL